MKPVLAVIVFLAVFVHQSLAQSNSCNSTNCIAPNCRCMSTSVPGGFSLANTPQLVFLSFDGAITETTYPDYNSLLTNRINPNGCPIGMTFFINHEYNDYTLTHTLYYKRQEIATTTVSHSFPSDSWANKTTKAWIDEIGGMRDAAAKFANIPKSAIRAARSPYLQTSGDNTFLAMRNLSMFYDSSFTTTNFTNPPVWPYTLDQGLQQECTVPPCPQSKHVGIWTVPMVALTYNTTMCSMADACASQPNTADETYQFLKTNFERHYKTSKAPFGVYLNANAWFSVVARLDGYKRFLDFLATMEDVWIVPISRGLDWMKTPKPLAEVPSFFNCPTLAQSPCSSTSCFYDGEASPVGARLMKSCVPCPDVYPWTGNPLGTV